MSNNIKEALSKSEIKKLIKNREKHDISNFCLLVPYNKAYNYVKELYGDVEIFAKGSNPNAFIIPIDDAKEIERKYNDNAVLFEIPHIYKSIDDFEVAYANGDITIDFLNIIRENKTNMKSLSDYLSEACKTY